MGIGASHLGPNEAVRDKRSLILGDDDGLVVVERTEIDAALEKSLKRMEAEVKKSEQLRAGISSVELNKLGKMFEALGLVEE